MILWYCSLIIWKIWILRVMNSDCCQLLSTVSKNHNFIRKKIKFWGAQTDNKSFLNFYFSFERSNFCHWQYMYLFPCVDVCTNGTKAAASKTAGVWAWVMGVTTNWTDMTFSTTTHSKSKETQTSCTWIGSWWSDTNA